MHLLYFKHFPILSNALNSVSLSFTVFIIFRVFDFIVLFYTSFKTFLMVQFFSIFFSIFMSFSIPLAMSSHRHQREMTPIESLEPIQGIALQGPFAPFDLPMECFYSQESCDHFYISFQSHRIKVKRSIDPHDFQDTPLTAILKERGWKSFFTLQGFYYPYWFTCFM